MQAKAVPQPHTSPCVTYTALTRSAIIANFSTLINRTRDAITRIRMQAARHLLHFSSLTISRIAEQTGFYDTAAFCRRFQAYTGLTPTEFRRQHDPNRA